LNQNIAFSGGGTDVGDNGGGCFVWLIKYNSQKWKDYIQIIISSTLLLFS